MKVFKETNLIVSLSIQNSGAIVQQQLLERVFVFSDEVLRFLLEILVLLDYLALAWLGLIDFLFIGWPQDLLLILEAAVRMVLYASIPASQATG